VACGLGAAATLTLGQRRRDAPEADDCGAVTVGGLQARVGGVIDGREASKAAATIRTTDGADIAALACAHFLRKRRRRNGRAEGRAGDRRVIHRALDRVLGKGAAM